MLNTTQHITLRLPLVVVAAADREGKRLERSRAWVLRSWVESGYLALMPSGVDAEGVIGGVATSGGSSEGRAPGTARGTTPQSPALEGEGSSPAPRSNRLTHEETVEAVGGPAMCSYREYDEQSGETYACGLRVHSVKVKHTRGEVVL